MNIISIIPARMNSSRFPGKPLAKINGIPMVGHCYFRSKMCESITETYVATCDHEIKEYINSINGKVIMTSTKHERATDRTAEAMISIEKQTGIKTDIVVMIQGDEPMIEPKMITAAIKPLIDDQEIFVTNLMSEIKNIKEFNDPNEVKVVVDNNNDALYFSREPVPSQKKYQGEATMYKQVCVIPFRRDFLIEFNNIKQTPLEIIESIDMLRILENKKKVKMVLNDKITYSVDTEDDLKNVSEKMLKDTFINKYK
tara:strand:+ start:174 stop:941 length:768 start_codon:yes stop_codon:yes gene_type:complete